MDKYSKTILTVIAAQLVVLIFQNFGVGKATAEQQSLLRVQICGYLDNYKNDWEINCAQVVNNHLKVGNRPL